MNRLLIRHGEPAEDGGLAEPGKREVYPPIMINVVSRKQFIEGIALTGIKG